MSAVLQREFMSVCLNRLTGRSDDGSNYVTNTDRTTALSEAIITLQEIRDLLQYDSLRGHEPTTRDLLTAKTKCADLANLTMILWNKL